MKRHPASHRRSPWRVALAIAIISLICGFIINTSLAIILWSIPDPASLPGINVFMSDSFRCPTTGWAWYGEQSFGRGSYEFYVPWCEVTPASLDEFERAPSSVGRRLERIQTFPERCPPNWLVSSQLEHCPGRYEHNVGWKERTAGWPLAVYASVDNVRGDNTLVDIAGARRTDGFLLNMTYATLRGAVSPAGLVVNSLVFALPFAVYWLGFRFLLRRQRRNQDRAPGCENAEDRIDPRGKLNWTKIVVAAFVILLLSSVLNFAIVGACAYFAPRPTISPGTLAKAKADALVVSPSGWPGQNDIHAVGYHVSEPPGRSFGLRSGNTWAATIEVTGGWPFCSCRGLLRGTYSRTAGGVKQLPPEGAVVVGSFTPTPQDALAIPYQPIWTGLLANVIFYAVFLSGICLLVLRFRRDKRLLRGGCPKCGYPRGVSPVCTECGYRLKVRDEPEADSK